MRLDVSLIRLFLSDDRFQTLISKTVQNLSNLAEFGYKEPYMADMNEFITGNIDNMKSFIDSASVRAGLAAACVGQERWHGAVR